jgi:hypothetical protein
MLERDAAPGIHRIDHAFVNFYLVEEGEGVTVVDPATPAPGVRSSTRWVRSAAP